MKFNQDLIAKARKGEIAILNDGSVEELNKVLSEVWPGVGKANGTGKYYFKNRNMPKDWSSDDCCYNTESHSVKDFFMPDTKDTPIFRKENDSQYADLINKNNKPRTYRVTRQQMKEIYEAIDSDYRHEFAETLMVKKFGYFDNEGVFKDEDIKSLCGPVPKPILQSIFPEYFHIPEGEPVLVRHARSDSEWFIRISDGKGDYYEDGKIKGESSKLINMTIIPFTKNPPK